MPTYPVRLRGSPLYLVDLPLSGGVSQNWVLDSPRHLLDVPDQGLDVEEEGIHLHFKMDTTLRAKDRVYISSYGNQVSCSNFDIIKIDF